MELAHFGHACVLVQTDDARMLIDPGTLADGFGGVRDLDAVLITHQHPDHLDLERLPALLAANPRAQLLVDPGSAPKVAAAGLSARVVEPGDSFGVGGSTVEVLGGRHAVVHTDIPIVPNGAFAVDDGAFFHPGDSWFVPPHDVDVLGVPTSGPWMKLSEAIDYLRAVAPRVAVPIHEAALRDPAPYFAYLTSLAPADSSFRPLAPGISHRLDA